MNKILILLIFLSFNSFSQKIGKLDYSISEIDSLCNFESCLKVSDLGGQLTSEITDSAGKHITSGIGACSIELHSVFIDSLYYKTLSNKKKRFYNNDECCNLLRIDYGEYVEYDNDKNTYSLDMKLYYCNRQLFYIKYIMISGENSNCKNIACHNFFYVDLDKELTEDISLKNWLIGKKEEVEKKCSEWRQ